MKRLIGSLDMRMTAALAVLFFTGCTFLPSAGPSDYRIRKEAGRVAGGGGSYDLLPVNGETIDALQRFSPKPSYVAAGGRNVMKLFGSRGIEALGQGSAQSIQPGDVVHIAIFESGGGLFQPMAVDRGGGTPVTSLPAQQIDQRGEITVPYAGRIRAIDRVPGDLEKEITGLLAGKTVDPQVIVTVAKREGGNLVSVGGDVKAPRQVPVTLAGTRLIDAITSAGGPTARPHEVMVTVTRNGNTRSDTLQNLFDNPGKNILLQPADTVLLRNVSMGYMVFGASASSAGSFVPIPVEDLSLAQAMAQSGGPSDMRANPAAVFVYRQESRRVLEALGQSDGLSSDSGTVPVIYQLELQNPEGFFYANNFMVRDQDIVYYANAGAVGVGKFMGLLNTLLSPVVSTAGGAATVRVLAPGAF